MYFAHFICSNIDAGTLIFHFFFHFSFEKKQNWNFFFGAYDYDYDYRQTDKQTDKMISINRLTAMMMRMWLNRKTEIPEAFHMNFAFFFSQRWKKMQNYKIIKSYEFGQIDNITSIGLFSSSSSSLIFPKKGWKKIAQFSFHFMLFFLHFSLISVCVRVCIQHKQNESIQFKKKMNDIWMKITHKINK